MPGLKRRENPGIWRLPLALSGSSPGNTASRGSVFARLPWAQVLATIGASPARETGGSLEVSVKELERPPPRQVRRRRVIFRYRELSFPDQSLVAKACLA